MSDPLLNPPKDLCCPISDDIFNDPVLLIETGQTYSRSSIEEWFQKGHRTCPLTGQALQSTQLAPNYVVKGLVQAWLEKQNGSVSQQKAEQPAYPTVYHGSPQHRLQQLDEILRHVSSPRMEVHWGCLPSCSPWAHNASPVGTADRRSGTALQPHSVSAL